MTETIYNSLLNKIEIHKKIDAETYHNARLLLKTYSTVAWENATNYQDIVCEHSETYGTEDYSGLEIMSQLGEEKKARELKDKLMNVAENMIMLEAIERALIHVKEYPYNGQLYYEIISKNFFVKYKYSEREMLESLDMARTTYYRKRKEAIHLFGVSLWGFIIPTIMKTLPI
ncbi:hypothetical protein [Maledivibacter halophilus]|uniref:Phage transcriptional regulator, ArpU family n=1 Tax=Maledivibacter halophilus TaxID=36842 RepID=A0A1T5LND7_9FIRM|nr:hypothetical protein [Maledivibacter halophilus]SKC77486.1 hypothetical protein SAMN02194393_03142 [Maledivibacter halophilus]